MLGEETTRTLVDCVAMPGTSIARDDIALTRLKILTQLDARTVGDVKAAAVECRRRVATIFEFRVWWEPWASE
jgi:hypothetical protein